MEAANLQAPKLQSKSEQIVDRSNRVSSGTWLAEGVSCAGTYTCCFKQLAHTGGSRALVEPYRHEGL